MLAGAGALSLAESSPALLQTALAEAAGGATIVDLKLLRAHLDRRITAATKGAKEAGQFVQVGPTETSAVAFERSRRACRTARHADSPELFSHLRAPVEELLRSLSAPPPPWRSPPPPFRTCRHDGRACGCQVGFAVEVYDPVTGGTPPTFASLDRIQEVITDP